MATARLLGGGGAEGARTWPRDEHGWPRHSKPSACRDRAAAGERRRGRAESGAAAHQAEARRARHRRGGRGSRAPSMSGGASYAQRWRRMGREGAGTRRLERFFAAMPPCRHATPCQAVTSRSSRAGSSPNGHRRHDRLLGRGALLLVLLAAAQDLPEAQRLVGCAPRRRRRELRACRAGSRPRAPSVRGFAAADRRRCRRWCRRATAPCGARARCGRSARRRAPSTGTSTG